MLPRADSLIQTGLVGVMLCLSACRIGYSSRFAFAHSRSIYRLVPPMDGMVWETFDQNDSIHWETCVELSRSAVVLAVLQLLHCHLKSQSSSSDGSSTWERQLCPGFACLRPHKTLTDPSTSGVHRNRTRATQRTASACSMPA